MPPALAAGMARGVVGTDDLEQAFEALESGCDVRSEIHQHLSLRSVSDMIDQPDRCAYEALRQTGPRSQAEVRHERSFIEGPQSTVQTVQSFLVGTHSDPRAALLRLPQKSASVSDWIRRPMMKVDLGHHVPSKATQAVATNSALF